MANFIERNFMSPFEYAIRGFIQQNFYPHYAYESVFKELRSIIDYFPEHDLLESRSLEMLVQDKCRHRTYFVNFLAILQADILKFNHLEPSFLRDAVHFLVDEATLNQFPGVQSHQAHLFLNKIANLHIESNQTLHWLWLHQCLFERLYLYHEHHFQKRILLKELGRLMPLMPALDTPSAPQAARWPSPEYWSFSEFVYFLLWLYHKSGHEYHFLHPHHPMIPIGVLQTVKEAQLIDEPLYLFMMKYAGMDYFLELPSFEHLQKDWQTLEFSYHLNRHLLPSSSDDTSDHERKRL